mgnify:CR=1 FL=1
MNEKQLAPAHDTDDIPDFSGAVELNHAGEHSFECHCVGCMM